MNIFPILIHKRLIDKIDYLYHTNVRRTPFMYIDKINRQRDISHCYYRFAEAPERVYQILGYRSGMGITKDDFISLDEANIEIK